MRNDEESERKCDRRDIAGGWALLAVLLAGSIGWSVLRALIALIQPLLEI